MKILFVTPYFYPQIGGLEHYVYEIATRLQKKHNHTCSIVTTSEKETTPQQEFIQNLKIYRLPVTYTLSNTPFNIQWYSQIQTIINTESPDIINAHSPVPGIADIAFLLRKHIPYILTYHAGSMKKGNALIDLFIDAYERIILSHICRKSTAIISYHSDFITSLSQTTAPVHEISPGVDTTLFSPGNTKRKNSILYVGKIDSSARWKGIDVLFEAFALFIKDYPTYTLDLVGTGNDIQFYTHMAKTLNIQNHIHFHGKLEGIALRDMYRSAKVLVLPSTTDAESFGMVLLEAMATKTPVIASNVGGIKKLLRNNKNIMFEPNDSKGIYKALILSIKNNSNNSSTSIPLRIQDYSWDKITYTYDKIFKEL